jgi:hypothetical protein
MKEQELRRNPNNDAVILCCGSKRCPEVIIDEQERVHIKDDDGATVTMSVEQAGLIQRAIDILTKDND